MGVWGVRGSMGEYGQLLRNLGQQKWSSNKSKKHLTSLQIVNVTAGKCCAVVIVISEISVKSKLAECGKGGPKQPRYSLIPKLQWSSFRLPMHTRINHQDQIRTWSNCYPIQMKQDSSITRLIPWSGQQEETCQTRRIIDLGFKIRF